MMPASVSRCLAAVLFAAATLSVPSARLSAAPEVLDGIAAVVNGDVITFSQVRELVAARERALKAQFSGQELANKIKEARMGALKDLIDRSLVLQEFKKKEFNVPARVIDERIAQIIREDFGGDRQAFVRTLNAQGYTMTKLREVERDKFIVQAMRYSNIKGELLVSPQRVNEFYSTTARKDFTSEEQIRLRILAIRKGDAGGLSLDDPQRAMISEIRSKVARGGAKFEQLAAMYSDDPSRANGGEVGWVDRKSLRPEMAKVAFALKPKTVSEIVEIENAYFLLWVEERKGAQTKGLGEIRPDIERRLQGEDRQRMTEQWLEGLRKKAYIRMF